MKSSSKNKRALIYLVYLLPLIVGLLCLLLAFLPHLWFNYGGAVQKTMSPMELLTNTWSICNNALDAEAAEADTILFSQTMIFFCVLVWISVILYALYAVMVAIFSIRAFSAPPTTRTANRSKRWLHLLCPNAICYALFGLLPIFPSFFPYILSHFYQTRLWIDAKVFFFGLPDPVWVILLVGILELSFLLTRNIQAREHMDLFRLYKKKPEEK